MAYRACSCTGFQHSTEVGRCPYALLVESADNGTLNGWVPIQLAAGSGRYDGSSNRSRNV
jgi:hypothetical protein